jgi:hypothetical protein
MNTNRWIERLKQCPNYESELEGATLLLYPHDPNHVRIAVYGKLKFGYNVAYLDEQQVKRYLIAAHRAVGRIYAKVKQKHNLCLFR